MKITETVKGSGFWDLHLEDNSWARVEDDALPSNYTPGPGDDVEMDQGAVVFVKASVEAAGGPT